MYTIQENIKPIADLYDQWLNGFYLSGLLQFKAQKEVGGDYISKVFKGHRYQINKKYENAVLATQNPTFKGFLQDNFIRILALNGVERLVSAAQATATLKDRVGRPNTLSFLFTQIMNDGAFRGTLRGLSINLLQTSLVLWPSVALTNKTKGGIVDFLSTFLILDALLYPLDTLKNIMYANTAVPRGLRESFRTLETSFAASYRGIVQKSLFNIPFASALYFTAQGNDLSLPAWLATFLFYPLATAKTNLQVTGTSVNLFRFASYKGVVPFVVVNYLFAWQLTALYSPQKLKSLHQSVKHQAHEKLGYY